MDVRRRRKYNNTKRCVVSYLNNSDLPDLPIGCTDIRATTEAGHEHAVANHIDVLPGITNTRFERLSTIATAPSSTDGDDAGSPVVGLSDLLRTKPNGEVSLHPRVTQVVRLVEVDLLLDVVIDELGWEPHCKAYEHPIYIRQAGDVIPEREVLYPPEYHVQTADVVRGLRSYGILTSLCPPGEPSYPPSWMVKLRIATLDDMNQTVSGVATLYQPEDATEPKLYIDGYSNLDARPSVSEVARLCRTLFDEYNTSLELVEDSDWRQRL
jgi:hypothetical protein